MGILDGLLGQLGNLEELGEKLGLPADQVKSLAAQLPAQLQAGGNPIEALAEIAGKFGVSQEQIQSLIGQLGGGAGGLMGMLDKNGDGNPLDELGGIAKGLFGGN